MSSSVNLYKVKLRPADYRLVYQVIDSKIVVLILDVDRRDTIYKNM
ncbi:type II toxin-antitoxin system RelE family toxin [Acinetobacter radioresistens]|nr:type II toxin-antitoxin system RelE/ParE family toxin [Acinetobacter radioresistens]RJL73366.1 hypothetical protein D5055_04295 [Acinetobacter radioresistens]